MRGQLQSQRVDVRFARRELWAILWGFTRHTGLRHSLTLVQLWIYYGSTVALLWLCYGRGRALALWVAHVGQHD